MKTKPSRQYDPAPEFRGRLPRRAPSLRSLAVYGLLQLALIGLVSSAAAQVRTNIYFTPYSTRITVPVLSGKTTVISNQVRLVNFDTNPPLVTVYFDVSGLPPGASYTLTDTNGTALLSTTKSTPLLLTVNTTNIQEGEYTFTLNAGGTNADGAIFTNYMPFVLQAGYIWNGAGYNVFNVSNNWAVPSSWVGGVVPGATDDVLFADAGAQTNFFSASGCSFTNITVSADTTVGSIRFMQSLYTNATVTNTLYHTINIAPGKTLALTGPRGFRLLRDYLDEFSISGLTRTLGVSIRGGGGAKLIVSNETANIAFLIDKQGSSLTPSLNISNLDNFVTDVSRIGWGDYQLYPNYREFNNGYHDTNYITDTYIGVPRQMLANVFLARTNVIKAVYADPSNYTDENTRGYGLTFLNNESQGNGSSTVVSFWFGYSNIFFADGVCFVGANSASASTGATGNSEFGTNDSVAVFRGTNGGRMSVFTVADDGGPNAGNSNLKGTVDFQRLRGTVDILTDRLYLARDRTGINSNQTPNVQADLLIGKGIVDVNTAILGFQEHTNKVDWTSPPYGAQPYLGYCQGRLVVTNGGTFRVNGNLTLGYTADPNPVASAQQFNTYGRITVWSGSTVSANNIIEDGGSNWYDSPAKRQNSITLQAGSTLIVSNSLGAAPGLPLDTLSFTAGTLTLFVNAAQTPVHVRNLLTSGLTPGTIKIASLTGVTSYPVQIPLISYSGDYTAPSLVADLSALGANYHGYIVNNSANHSIDVAITTNTASSLVWSGTDTSTWNLNNTHDWIGSTNVFSIGDFVVFDDSSANNNVGVVGLVIPGQSTNTPGMTVSNSTHAYVFTGDTIGGAGTILKVGSNNLQMDASAQGAIAIKAGSVTGSGGLGAATVFSNTSLSFSGGIVGGVTSTGTVALASSSSVFGPVSVQGGALTSTGTVDTSSSGAMMVAGGAMTTNWGTISVNGGASTVDVGSLFANFGTVNDNVNQWNVNGTLIGNGTFYDPQSTSVLANSPPGRVVVNGGGVLAPGTPNNTVATMTIDSRFDLGEATGNPGMVVIKVDWNDPQVNDKLALDRWNNLYGMLLMTNLIPGTYTNGQVYEVIHNNGVFPSGNIPDVPFGQPMMWPPIPAPGLAWQLDGIRAYGTIGITNQLVWRGNNSGNWNTSEDNWSGLSTKYADGYGVLFDDSANSGATSISLAQLLYPATNPNDTNNMLVSPGIMVSNNLLQYTFSSPNGTNCLAGRANLYKTGPGTLAILVTNNTYSGNTTIDGGTLMVQWLAGWANPSSIGQGAFTTATNAIYTSAKSTSAGNQIPLTIGNGAKLQYIGTNAATTDRHMLLNAGGGVIDVSTNSTLLILSGTINGVGSLTKAGLGTLQLNTAANPYSGGTIINAGALRLTATAAGTGGIILSNGGTLQLTNSFTLTNTIYAADGAETVAVLPGSTSVSSGLWSGNGTVTFINATNLFVFNNSLAGFSGTISCGTSSGSFRFNNATNANNCKGSPAANFDLGTGSAKLANCGGGGLTYDLGSLAGGAGTVLSGSVSNTPTPTSTYSIGANGGNTTFSGTIANGVGAVSVTKVGIGILWLNGNNTYTGPTTVSYGTLGGTGAITGPLTVQSGATLAPGTSIGSFSVGGTVNLNSGGRALMEINRGVTPNSDRLVAPSVVAASGAIITVTNIGTPNLAFQDSFKLLSTPLSGSGYTLNLPALPNSNLYWTNKLGIDGTIEVAAIVNPLPPTIGVSRIGSQLTLSWPPDHMGWTLLTNSVGVTASGSWFPYPSSDTLTSITLTLDPAQTNVFYKLVYPYP